jgi:hypothetical protein
MSLSNEAVLREFTDSLSDRLDPLHARLLAYLIHENIRVQAEKDALLSLLVDAGILTRLQVEIGAEQRREELSGQHLRALLPVFGRE